MSLVKSMSTVVFICLLFQQCGSNEKSEPQKQEAVSAEQGRGIWTKEQANAWYDRQPWLVGCNFIVSTAINQLEMFQQESFDTASINRELGLAASLGMNTVRVYLHDLLWQQDSTGFLNRLDIFLNIARKHKIKPLFVLFDSCWDPFPQTGKQRAPKPHVHNSGWVQSPGLDALKDSTQYPRLEQYVKGVVGRFARDTAVLGWDVWNEPDNLNKSEYGKVESADKALYVFPLLKKAFEWSRAVNPDQPLTSGVWTGAWIRDSVLGPIEDLQLAESDVLSFHNYEPAKSFEESIKSLESYGRPILCTEYMARGNGSFFSTSLPLAKKYKVAAYNWGLVDGKTQTKYGWDSWTVKYSASPKVWFHDVFHKDGTPYIKEETDLIKKLTAEN